MTPTPRTDVLVVGSGIMGSVVARLLRDTDPALRITMVDGGTAIGEVPGRHLHDVDDPVLWSRYNEQVTTGIQGMYTGAEVVRDVAGSLTDLPPGMFHALAFGEDAEAMPATALAWNAGGMGVHWTAATPWPAGDEVFDFGDPARWAADLDTARRVLAVTPPRSVRRRSADWYSTYCVDATTGRDRTTAARSRCPWPSPRPHRAPCRAPLPGRSSLRSRPAATRPSPWSPVPS